MRTWTRSVQQSLIGVGSAALAVGTLAATAASPPAGIVRDQLVGPGGAPSGQVSPGASPSSPSTGTGAISGVVTDGTTGAPIPGAIVVLGSAGRGAPGAQSRQVSDGQGRFAFVGVPASPRLSISANRPGYLPDEMTTVAAPTELSLAEGEWLNQVRVVLRRLAAMGGTVTDERNEPVVGVTVRAYARVHVAGRERLAAAATAMTDDRGQYRLSNLLPGRYLVSVPSIQASVPASTPEARLANLPDAQVAALEAAGQVTSPATIHIDEAVRLVVGPYPTPPPSAAGTVLAYPAAFHPTAITVAEATTVTLQFGETRTDVNVVLTPTGTATVGGRVQGGPATRSAMTVRLVAAGLEDLGLGAETATALVDRDGTFRLARVPVGSYTLSLGALLGEYRVGTANFNEFGRFRFPGIGSSSSMTSNIDGYPGVSYSQSSIGSAQLFSDQLALTVGPSGIQDVVLSLREGVSASGTVRIDLDPSSPAPSPLPFINVTAEPADGSSAMTRRTAQVDREDPSHPFRFQNMAPGRYMIRTDGNAWRVKSVMAGGREHRDTPLDASDSLSDIVVTLTNQFATVTGTVLDDRGAPSPDVMVGVFPADRSGWANFGLSSPRMRATMTTDGGRYRISPLPAGEYFVVVIPTTRQSDWRNPSFFESVAGSASRVTVDWGQTRDQGLRVERR